jgi:hypothetical protein
MNKSYCLESRLNTDMCVALLLEENLVNSKVTSNHTGPLHPKEVAAPEMAKTALMDTPAPHIPGFRVN